MKRGARGIPAHGEFLLGPGTLYPWLWEIPGRGCFDQGGPLRSSTPPSRPKPASVTATPRMQCNPSLGERVQVTSSSYRTLGIRLPNPCTQPPRFQISLLMPNTPRTRKLRTLDSPLQPAPLNVENPQLSGPSFTLQPTLKAPRKARSSLYPQPLPRGFLDVDCGPPGPRPRRCASLAASPAERRRVPRSKARSPASF